MPPLLYRTDLVPLFDCIYFRLKHKPALKIYYHSRSLPNLAGFLPIPGHVQTQHEITSDPSEGANPFPVPLHSNNLRQN